MALRVPISWLNDYVKTILEPNQLAERLTLAGLEIEYIESIGETWDEEKLLVGEVVEITSHPNADRLCIAKVSYGQGNPLTIVTGAPNFQGLQNQTLPFPMKVPLALPGSTLIDPYNEEGKSIQLRISTIREVRSEGMLCSEKELGLSDDHEGAMTLPDDAPVGKSLRSYLGDHILHFDIKGGFSHLMCVFGIAREVAALTETPLDHAVMETLSQHPGEITPQPGFVNLEIRNPEVCPRYSALRIKNVTVKPSPFWMQQRLLRAGMRPINNIVDITNYVMLEMGQPLHAFDYQRLQDRANGETPSIIVRTAETGEKMTTLDDVERPFDEEMLLITDSQGAVAIAGVMGGGETEVSEVTTDILLESANFEFLNNRRTAQVLKLRTEASERFGKRIDPELTLTAALRAAHLMEQYADGVLEPVYGDLYLKKKETITVQLHTEYVYRLLGIAVPESDIIRTLEMLEFKVTPGEPLQVEVPSHRMDITLPADLVEEVARVYGYNHMKPTLMEEALPEQKTNYRLQTVEQIRDILVNAGMDEIITYSIVNPDEEGHLNPHEPLDKSQFLPLKNPLSAEKSHMRRSLLPGALNTVRNNLHHQGRVRIFEVGSVFLPQDGELLPEEPQRLSIVMAGDRFPGSWITGQNSEHMNFYDIKGFVEALLEGMHVRQVVWKKGKTPSFHPGRCAEVIIEGKSLGYVGELHPKVHAAFGLPEMPVCAAEFDLEVLLEQKEHAHTMEDISHYEPIFEDLAFVVDEGVPSEMVANLIARVGKPLLRKVELFDVFRGERVGNGKKSLAYSLTYQSFERTLTDQDVEPIRTKIVQRLERELNASLRL